MDLARIPTPQNIMYIKLYIVIPQQFSYHHQSHKVQCCTLGAVSCKAISFGFPIFPHQTPKAPSSRTSSISPRFKSTLSIGFSKTKFPSQSFSGEKTTPSLTSHQRKTSHYSENGLRNQSQNCQLWRPATQARAPEYPFLPIGILSLQ